MFGFEPGENLFLDGGNGMHGIVRSHCRSSLS